MFYSFLLTLNIFFIFSFLFYFDYFKNSRFVESPSQTSVVSNSENVPANVPAVDLGSGLSKAQQSLSVSNPNSSGFFSFIYDWSWVICGGVVIIFIGGLFYYYSGNYFDRKFYGLESKLHDTQTLIKLLDEKQSLLMSDLIDLKVKSNSILQFLKDNQPNGFTNDWNRAFPNLSGDALSTITEAVQTGDLTSTVGVLTLVGTVSSSLADAALNVSEPLSSIPLPQLEVPCSLPVPRRFSPLIIGENHFDSTLFE